MSTGAAVLDVPALLGDLQDGMDQADACVDAVVAGVDALVAGLPGHASGARTATAALRRDFDAGTSRVRRAAACGGDPAALRAAGTAWAAGTGRPDVAALLRRLADAITSFWVDVAVACATLAAGLYAAAVAATSPMGVPGALESAAAAVGSFVVVTGAAEGALAVAASAVATGLGRLA